MGSEGGLSKQLEDVSHPRLFGLLLPALLLLEGLVNQLPLFALDLEHLLLYRVFNN